MQTFNYPDKISSSFAMLIHDLKTPINAEILALELLIKNSYGKMTESQYEILQDILNSTKYMKSMTDNIMTKYKLDRNTINITLEKWSLEELIQQCIKETKYILQDKNQKIIFKNETKHKCEIFIDELEIKRVITNLIVNSSKYSTKNTDIIITLTENKYNIIFSIKDFGCGLKSEYLNNIFDKDVTIQQSTTNEKGTGLGLYIANEIIKAHGGKMDMKSVLNEGTTIKFWLNK